MAIKAFVVDDSAVVRKFLSDTLVAGGIEVVGTASDPLFAWPKMEANWPDVLVLDVEMPRMDGITFLKKVMSERPTPVVMCSTLTEKGCETTLQALAAGAVSFVTKPKMGGKNPLVVLDDADLKQAVELSAQSCFYSTGQRCTASSRIIVTDKIYPAFVEALKVRIEAIKVGAALAAGTDMGPVVSQGQLEQDLSYVEIGKAEGGNLVSGGSRIACHTGSGHEGYFMAPALFADTVPAMRINREEIFGPVASVIRVKDYEEALHVANDTEFGLSAGIATTA